MADILATYYGNNVGPSTKFRVVAEIRVTDTDPEKGLYLQKRYYVQVTTGMHDGSAFTKNLHVSWSSTLYTLSKAGNYAVQAWKNIGWVKPGGTVTYDANAYYKGSSGTTYKSTVSGTYRAPYYLTRNYYSNYATKAFAGALNEVSADKNVLVRSEKNIATATFSSGLHNYVQESAGTYLSREGFEATGYWGDMPEGGILVHQDTSFKTAVEVAAAFGKDLTKGNVTLNLYAQWQRIGYSVTYISVFGNVPENQFKTEGEDLVLSDTVPEREGYRCIGWSVHPDAKNVDYLPGDVYAVDENILLYAVWRKDGVLFKSENGMIRQGQAVLNGKAGVPYMRKNGRWKRGGA